MRDGDEIYQGGGLDGLHDPTGRPAPPELRELLRQVLAGNSSSIRIMEQQNLMRPTGRALNVQRLRIEVDGTPRSVVAKRFPPHGALLEQSVLTRWMPAAELGAHVPALLGSVAEGNGRWIWLVFEDIGDYSLDTGPFDEDRTRAAIELIARLHASFARHRMLGEIRRSGADLGAGNFSACIRDAAAALRAVRPPAVALSAANAALRDRLLSRLDALEQEQTVRTIAMAQACGVETMLHGDLWTSNIMVLPRDETGIRSVVMIDWDHVGVGPVIYDLSTLLLRFEPDRRTWVLDLYREEVARVAGWTLPDSAKLNELFQTCEYARLANALLWPAIGVSDPSPDWAWAWDELAEIEEWFDMLQPVLQS